MDSDELLESHKQILNVLTEGRGSGEPWGIATKGRLVEGTDYNRNTVRERLKDLRHAGHVELIHEPTSEWRFVSDPRSE